jgi:hypothetical protein
VNYWKISGKFIWYMHHFTCTELFSTFSLEYLYNYYQIITNDWLVCFIFHGVMGQNNYYKGNMPISNSFFCGFSWEKCRADLVTQAWNRMKISIAIKLWEWLWFLLKHTSIDLLISHVIWACYRLFQDSFFFNVDRWFIVVL